MYQRIDSFFRLTEHETSVRTEFLAKFTTFFTLAYIIFVQPAVLSAAGMDFGAVFVATCVTSGVATIMMAVFANYPVAVAPAMGPSISRLPSWSRVGSTGRWLWAPSRLRECCSSLQPESDCASASLRRFQSHLRTPLRWASACSSRWSVCSDRPCRSRAVLPIALLLADRGNGRCWVPD